MGWGRRFPTAELRTAHGGMSVRRNGGMDDWNSPLQGAPTFFSEAGFRSGCVRSKECTEMFRQDLRLVDWNQGPAVVDPHQLRVLKMLGQSLGVGGRHQFVLTCPDDEDRPAERALLLGPLEEQPFLRYVSKVLAQVTTNLPVVARRMYPAHKEVVGNPPLRQGAESQRKMPDPARPQ